MSNKPFHYQDPFPLSKDQTEYYLLTRDHVSVSELEGQEILKVDPQALTLLAQAPSFSMMLSVLLWLSFLYGLYNGAMIPALTEIMPVEVRVAGFSLAYSLATAVFGGFTPVISTALIEYTGDKASPGYWMSFAAVCAMLATLYLYRRSALHLQTAR